MRCHSLKSKSSLNNQTQWFIHSPGSSERSDLTCYMAQNASCPKRDRNATRNKMRNRLANRIINFFFLRTTTLALNTKIHFIPLCSCYYIFKLRVANPGDKHSPNRIHFVSFINWSIQISLHDFKSNLKFIQISDLNAGKRTHRFLFHSKHRFDFIQKLTNKTPRRNKQTES